MAAHRYWRIELKVSSGNTLVGAAELELRETIGGADVSSSTFATAQSVTSTNSPSRGFDNNIGTIWASGTAAAGDWIWIQQDFGSGNEKDIAEVEVTADDLDIIVPDGVRISYSDNGTDFTVTDTYDNLGLATNSVTQYTVTGAGGGGPTTSPSVNVTRGSTVIASGSTTATLTESTDFTLTDTGATKWFARITNTRHSGMGQISGGGNHNGDQFTAHLEYSGNNVVITRQGTGLDCRVDWEVIEYVGPSGGANEWIVRERGVKTIAAASLSGSYANPGGLVSTGDGLIWITGQSTSNSTRNNVNDGQFMARFNGSNFEFERRNSTSSAEVSYAIVEYVGSNWSVQQQEFTEGSNNSDQTISPVLSDFNTTIHHAQPTYGSASGGLDDISARTDITSNSNINFLSNGDFANRRTSVWFLSNADMSVQRLTGTMAGAGEEEVEDFALTAVTLDETSVVGSSDSTGSGTAFPRGFINYTLVDATTLRLRQSDNGQTSRFSITAFSWPQDAASSGESRSASIVAASTVSAARTISRARSSSITAVSAVTASGTRRIWRSAALAAVSGVAATGKRAIKRSAAISGVSAASTSRAITRSRSASVAATSAVSAIAAVGTSRSSSIAAASSVAAKSVVTRKRSASVAAISAVSASAGITRRRSASVAAASVVTADRSITRRRSASVSATSTVTASSSLGQTASSLVSASSAVSANAVITRRRSAAVSATSILKASGSKRITRSASIGATSTVTANGQTAGSTARSAEVSASSSLTTNREVVRSRSATVPAKSSLSSAPRRTVRRSAQIAASSQASSSRVVTRRRSASVASGSVVGAAAIRRAVRSSRIEATSSVSSRYTTSAPPLANPVRTIRAEHQDRVIRVAAQDRSISAGTQDRVIRSPAQDRSIRVASQARSIRAPAQNRTIIAS